MRRSREPDAVPALSGGHPSRWPASALFLSVHVLVMSGAIVFRLAHHLPGLSFLHVLVWQGLAWSPWLLIAPVLLDAAEGHKRLARAGAAQHLAAAVLVAGANTAWFFALSSHLSPLLDAPETRYGVYRWFFLFWLAFNFAAYWAVLGVAAVARQAREPCFPVAAAAEPHAPVVEPPTAPGASARRILVEANGESRLVSLAEIDWIEAQDYYCVVHVGASGYWVKRSLDQFEKELEAARFARIHRSTIVNVERVVRIEKDESGQPCAVLAGGARRRFSQVRWQTFRRNFALRGQ